jgi:hypothetical protein
MKPAMKSILLLLAISLSALSLSAQPSHPVSWSTRYEQVEGYTYDLHLKATAEPGWYIYSQHIQEGGPIPTSFYFDKGDHYQLEGEVEEQSEHRKAGIDEFFDMEVIKYAESVTFTQRVTVKDFSQPISGYLEYMTCDDEQCLPPREENFSFLITPPAENAAAAPAPGTDEQTGEQEEAPAVAETGLLSNAYRAGNAPIEWKAGLRRISEKTYELLFHADIDEGWYTYSQLLEGDGPVPTSINFLDPERASPFGEPQETGPKRLKEYDSNFEMDLIKFKESATFRQKIRLSAPVESVEGFVEYMLCNESQCLSPVEVPFTVYPDALQVVLGSAEDTPAIAESEAEEPVLSEIYQLPKPDLTTPAAQCGEIETV